MYSKAQIFAIWIVVAIPNVVLALIYINLGIDDGHANTDGGAITMALFWFIVVPVGVAWLTGASFSPDIFIVHGTRVHILEELLLITTCSCIFLIVAWIIVEDETGVPPGIRFLSNFYRHPAYRSIERATASEQSPTFDVSAFQAAIDRTPSRWAKRLQTEELHKMKQAVEERAARMSAEEARLAEVERKRALADEARRKEEQAVVEAEIEVMRAAEELEKAKARLEERKKRR